jgi:hypothetical protein
MLRSRTTSKLQHETTDQISALNSKKTAKTSRKLHKYTCLVAKKALNVFRGFSLCVEGVKRSPSDRISSWSPAIFHLLEQEARSFQPSLLYRLPCDWLKYFRISISGQLTKIIIFYVGRIAQFDVNCLRSNEIISLPDE